MAGVMDLGRLLPALDQLLQAEWGAQYAFLSQVLYFLVHLPPPALGQLLLLTAHSDLRHQPLSFLSCLSIEHLAPDTEHQASSTEHQAPST